MRIAWAPQMNSLVSSIFPLFSTALWDLANSRPAHSLTLSSKLFLRLSCLILDGEFLNINIKLHFFQEDDVPSLLDNCSLLTIQIWVSFCIQNERCSDVQSFDELFCSCTLASNVKPLHRLSLRVLTAPDSL